MAGVMVFLSVHCSLLGMRNAPGSSPGGKIHVAQTNLFSQPIAAEHTAILARTYGMFQEMSGTYVVSFLPLSGFDSSMFIGLS